MKKESPQLLTVAEVAKELRVHRTYVNRLIQKREIAHVPVGLHRRLIPRTALADYLERTTVQPQPRV